MKTIKSESAITAFLAEQDGVTAMEYALLAALIFSVIVTAVALVGNNLATLFAQVAGLIP